MRKYSGVALVVFLSACAPEKQAAPVQAAAPAEDTLEKASLACSADEECGERRFCVRGACVGVSSELAECGDVRVLFGYDSADVPQDEMPKLARVAKCLATDKAMRVAIEGNTDERGTEEYNLSLGQRRAQQVERYLRMQGATDAQLSTVTYGKERPMCTDHTEACWSENRRASVKAVQISDAGR